MFKRNALIELRQWAARPSHKPIVLRGARQIGKTTLVDQFAAEYNVYLKLNLEKKIESGMSMDELITTIYLLNNQERKAAPTLLFIDEIQNSSQAVAMLRYFYEEVSVIDVIAADPCWKISLTNTLHFLLDGLNTWLCGLVLLMNFSELLEKTV